MLYVLLQPRGESVFKSQKSGLYVLKGASKWLDTTTSLV